MTQNLLQSAWAALDSAELRLFLDERIGGPGQYYSDDSVLHLPLAGASCRVRIAFRNKKIACIEPGAAFDAAEWERLGEEIETSILAGPTKFGRDVSFSSFRVNGWWRGERSGVQIIPLAEGSPRALSEHAEHPFLLEFPIRTAGFWRMTNYRRMREHRRLTHLLNVLLAGRTSHLSRRTGHFWAGIWREDGQFHNEWAHNFFFAPFGEAVVEAWSTSPSEPLDAVDAEAYYSVVGHDQKGLRVPSDLDDAICSYTQLGSENRDKFDRAAFWFDMASQQWTTSVSASFASLVSAIEALTDRGKSHSFYCDVCKSDSSHEVPGPTAKFRDFLERHAPGASLRKRRNEMYSLRSGILHGSDLMQVDQDLAFGWDPPGWKERDLHSELWTLTSTAMRDWLKNPPCI